MPTYTYKCECGETFDRVRSIADNVGTAKCMCGKDAKVFVTGGSTTILVGTNWAGKEAKMAADTAKIMRDGGEYVNNKEYWAEEE